MTPPVVVVIAPVTFIFPKPPKDKLLVAPVMVPILSVELASAFILAVDPNVIAPPQVLVKLPVPTLLKAPPEDIPVPLSVNASAPTVIPPCTSRAALAVTVTPPAVVPVAVAF